MKIKKNLYQKIKIILQTISTSGTPNTTPLYENIVNKVSGIFKYNKDNFKDFSSKKKLLLKRKKIIKTKKPSFKRTNSFLKRLSDSWRRPRGHQNKLLKEKKGKGKLVKIGYSTPTLLKGFNSKGYKETIVSHYRTLKDVDKTSEFCIISSRVGLRKRILLENYMIKNNYFVKNPIMYFNDINLYEFKKP